MKLNHINLCTTNVPALTDFLVTHFRYSVLQAGKVPAAAKTVTGGSEFAMLDGADGSSLVITEIAKPADPAYPPDFHFGIGMNSPEEVKAKHQELTDAGRKPEKVHSFEAAGSAWTSFYCPLGDGMKIEINHQACGQEGRSRPFCRP